MDTSKIEFRVAGRQSRCDFNKKMRLKSRPQYFRSWNFSRKVGDVSCFWRTGRSPRGICDSHFFAASVGHLLVDHLLSCGSYSPMGHAVFLGEIFAQFMDFMPSLEGKWRVNTWDELGAPIVAKPRVAGVVMIFPENNSASSQGKEWCGLGL